MTNPHYQWSYVMADKMISVDLEHQLLILVNDIARAQEANLLLSLSPSYETYETKKMRTLFFDELLYYFAVCYLLYKRADQHSAKEAHEAEIIQLKNEINHQAYLKKISAHIYFYSQFFKHSVQRNKRHEHYFALYYR